jgi:hypothetical protein
MLTPFWFLLTTGCTGLLGDTGEAGDPCEAGQRKEVEIGQGELAFEPITSETDRMTLIYGPQGGYHVVIAARARYLDATNFVAAYLRGKFDKDTVGETWPYIDFRCNAAEGSQDGVGMLLVFHPGEEPQDLHNKTLTVALEVTDLAGDVVSHEIKGLIWDPYQE